MNQFEKAKKILSAINSAGFEAYLVGGCVRDTITEMPVHDIDITTNALPEQIMRIFNQYRVIPTGLKHGTVTVLDDDVPFEITTYRVDGGYSDSRRPDNVSFTSSLTEDLARRDFTMNAIAMDIDGNLIDPFGGRADIDNKVIRCVGNPEIRFSEDSLRIMRAIRFSSQLGFKISAETSTAVHKLHSKLDLISQERIREELDKLICGRYCVDVLLEYSDIIVQIIPEFEPCIGFDQYSDYHKYDVWEHTVRAVNSVETANVKLRRTMLFHDIAKPACFKMDQNGKGHFKGHPDAGAEMTSEIMHRLRYDNKSIKDTAVLIKHHSDNFLTELQAKRKISEIGAERFVELIEVKKADNSAKHSFVLEETKKITEAGQLALKKFENGECLTLAQLAVNGNDLLSLGICGQENGIKLRELLEMVIDGRLENEKEQLLNYVKIKESATK